MSAAEAARGPALRRRVARPLGAALALAAGLTSWFEPSAAQPATPGPAPSAAAPPASSPAPALVAIVADLADVRKSELFGASAQRYLPEPGALRWLRRSAGGVAVTVRGAARHRGELVVAGGRAPIFRLRGDTWAIAPLGQQGRALLGTGPVFSIAIGKHIFVDVAGKLTRLGAVPDPVVALWAASERSVFVATDKAVLRRSGATFQPLPQSAGAIGFSGAAPHAITASVAIDLRSGTRTALPGTATTVAMSGGKPAAIVTTAAGRTALWRHGQPEPFELPQGLVATALAVDAEGRALLAGPAGAALLSEGSWRTLELADALPAPRPGPGPARSP